MLAAFDRPTRLALEMVAHEEDERRALEAELHQLARAWRDAEEIAAIADDRLLRERLTSRLDQLRASMTGRSSTRAGAASRPSSRSGAPSSS